MNPVLFLSPEQIQPIRQLGATMAQHRRDGFSTLPSFAHLLRHMEVVRLRCRLSTFKGRTLLSILSFYTGKILLFTAIAKSPSQGGNTP